MSPAPFASPLRPLLLAITLAVFAGPASFAEVVVPKDVPYRARDLEQAPVELVVIDDRIAMARGIGNVFMIKTPAGNVVYDTGVSWQSQQADIKAWP